MHLNRPAFLSFLSAALLATACGGSSSSTGTGGTGGFINPASSSASTTASSSGSGGTGGISFTTSSTSGTGGAGTGGMTGSSTGAGGMTASSSSGSGGMTASSSGSGGMTTSSSGSGGMTTSSSSGMPGCVTAASCPPPTTECATATCTAGACGFAFAAAGTPTAAQTTGDCHKHECDGAGNITSVIDNADVPVDGNACTGDICTAGVPSNPMLQAGTACGAGLTCNAGGVCTGCTAGTDCPGADTECKTRTCMAGLCGLSFATAGKLVAAQTAGDCHDNACDGAGNVTSVIDNADVPVDNNTCTTDACSGGVPGNPPVAMGTPCAQGSGKLCDATGACVACLAATDCAGMDTPCQKRTCSAGACGMAFAPSGTLAGMQLPGDCHSNTCDGAGNIVNGVDNTDVPVDGNACTADTCTAGAPSNPPLLAGTMCAMGNGVICDGAGACVQCLAASDCPGTDTSCKQRTCMNNACGLSFTASGLPVGTQTPGDCHSSQCDGAGNPLNVVDDNDLPVDGKQCTSDVCTAGVPSNPPLSAGTMCNQGGTTCDGMGNCGAVASPDVASTVPADATMAAAATPIAVTFTMAMNPTTLTAQTTAGACTGSIQVSLDGFVSCVAFSSATPVMSGGNTTATLTPAPALQGAHVYKIRVTTAAQSAGGVALIAQFTQPSGFTTTGGSTCDGSVVISQVYGGGGNTNAVYKNDFVELHNRGTTAVALTGLSLQYGSTAGMSWSSVVPLMGSIPAGGYFLVALSSGGANGVSLPTADLSSAAINLSATTGKIALISGTTAVAMGVCPPAAVTLDLVGYGAANCSTGTAVGALTVATAAIRLQSGCADAGNNVADFVTGPPAPRNSATAVDQCSCP